MHSVSIEFTLFLFLIQNFLGFIYTAQKMKFSFKDFFSKCDQIHRKLRIWPHLLKKSLMENVIFCPVIEAQKLFTTGAMITFRSARKLRSYLLNIRSLRADYWLLQVQYAKRCKVCENIPETSTFTHLGSKYVQNKS